MKKILISAVAAVALCGCSDDGGVVTQNNYQAEAVSFVAALETKVVDDQWGLDDRIGIYMVDNSSKTVLSENIEYASSSEGSYTTFMAVDGESAIYYPEITPATGVDFLAYYPYCSEITDYEYPLETSNQSDLTAIDFMVADRLEAQEEGSQSLTFNHVLSQITFAVTPGNGVSSEDLDGAVFSIKNIIVDGSYNIDSNTFAMGDSGEFDILLVDSYAQAIVIPQQIDVVEVQLSVPMLSVDFKVALPSEALTAEGGSEYQFNVTLNRTEATVSSLNINPWNSVDAGSANALESAQSIEISIDELDTNNPPTESRWIITDTGVFTYAKLVTLSTAVQNIDPYCKLELEFPYITEFAETSNSSSIPYLSGCVSITAPNATSIGQRSFGYNKDLEKISFEKVTSIGKSAFIYSENLSEIYAPKLDSIAAYAFEYCYVLTEVDLPSLRIIGESAFAECDALQELSLPSVTYLDESAFEDCSLIQSISLPSIKEIKSYAFSGCALLNSINIESATNVEGYAFSGCSKLKSISIPSLTTISEYMLSSTSLESISFPNAVTVMTGAFSDCSKLTNIDLPNVEELYAYAFSNCSSLTSIYFDKVHTASSSSFYNCTKLKSVDLPVATIIGNYAFSGCMVLETINIPIADVFGTYVFFNCDALTSVELPKATYLTNGMFLSCDNLVSVSAPLVTTIDSETFYYYYMRGDGLGTATVYTCPKLESVILPELKTIPASAFKSTNLFEANYPKVTTVGSSAFYSCDNLASCDIPLVETIGSSAFAYCISISSVEFDNAVKIESSTFYECSSLQSVKMSSVEIVDKYGFYNCPLLTDIELPIVSYIEEYGINNTPSLTNLTIATQSNALSMVAASLNTDLSGVVLTTGSKNGSSVDYTTNMWSVLSNSFGPFKEIIVVE